MKPLQITGEKTMNVVLQINSSLNLQDGQSTRLADQFVGRLREKQPHIEVIVRDLGARPLPHLDLARFGAFTTPRAQRSVEQQAFVAESDLLIDELRRADVIVIGSPMYNFGVPSPLKAYFDHIARAGETFRYTDTGSVGLLKGKKAYVLASRGGRYVGTPADTQTRYVRDFLRFIGIEQSEFIFAEGLATGEANKDESVRNALLSIERLIDREFAKAA
jgi:FMN-dependent NADH-azoreductase